MTTPTMYDIIWLISESRRKPMQECVVPTTSHLSRRQMLARTLHYNYSVTNYRCLNSIMTTAASDAFIGYHSTCFRCSNINFPFRLSQLRYSTILSVLIWAVYWCRISKHERAITFVQVTKVQLINPDGFVFFRPKAMKTMAEKTWPSILTASWRSSLNRWGSL